ERVSTESLGVKASRWPVGEDYRERIIQEKFRFLPRLLRTICNGSTPESFSSAIAVLQMFSLLTHRGSLFVLSISLFSFLTNPSILKILYDGRIDFCALYHTYHIDLDPVLDLQLVDICSRFARGDYSVASHERRPLRCFSHKQIRQNKDRFKNIHILRSLGSTSPKNHVNHETWLTRPLSSKYLEYAAHDVAIIHALDTQLIQVCYIQHPFLSLNLSQSKRCISIWNDAYSEQGNTYRSPLLPLEIIDFILSQFILLSPAKGVLVTYPLRLEFWK
ncbi:hypothetical protein F5050DRAFT_1793070, partial [Lentinula boryana]